MSTSLIKDEIKEEIKEEIKDEIKEETVDDINNSECSETYDPDEEDHQNIIFKKFLLGDKKFPQNLVGRFAELWGMMEQELKPNGVFALHWDEFTGDDDFKDLPPVKPWQDTTVTDALVSCFNYGLNEKFWMNYRKKHDLLKKYLDEITGTEKEKTYERGRVEHQRDSSRYSRSHSRRRRSKSKGHYSRSRSRDRYLRNRSKSHYSRSRSRSSDKYYSRTRRSRSRRRSGSRRRRHH
ncbi:hypothetical protein EHI8A_063640 [Entamoeba histolytica HM-1:IMSS-B]|uniref:Pre-mRNA polyadenylation factor Fip1 domain-containing protein n=5 Tax=Entamoeba histolytica TaxID=5759 RepID=C4LUB8_ENTH1|nr:hypothetical protein EHI_110710 [Entamoeba histolytica HM-1:IMSS]EMD45082.1 Hypothetical protein EHI5A_094210 [Entamoeba histolytica KU27]EMH72046.1 hypothetical protein EHI8A_063640 [Entamoeba histolytica HM-1:IMSS-B]ENY63715.1 hypothetical protein EHI7A_060550 [Entamoeba histolytica HM-1:IMSS-A]GAT92200.1 hypothetical protein CL6EHI_110710 [Entamoeba histolytica]EAL48883.1 hypothetical protein EHI_110710 [Entamoeba histolytica HM-1:IMSS]|eukprot:XP_654269.1 hypothetical protein EHI_110710 [Entamoeba histolytica HM-1:IMSS]